MENNERLKISRAVVVEGRDDVDAVSRACDALIIPTHGYGITRETWDVLAKAYREKGLIILTDPDLAGERIRGRLTERFPDSVQCWLTQQDAQRDGDIGIENARPEVIREALVRALELDGRQDGISAEGYEEVTAGDLARLGLSGGRDAAALRAQVCRELGIGYGNARAMVRKLRGFRIGKHELEEKVSKIR